VLLLNFHRRHLDSGQRAVCAVKAEEIMEELRREARERQSAAGGDRKSEEYKESVVQKIVQPVQTGKNTQEGIRVSTDNVSISPLEGRVVEQAARIFNTNHSYVQTAQKIQREALAFQMFKTLFQLTYHKRKANQIK
jgi:hypothetical protein